MARPESAYPHCLSARSEAHVLRGVSGIGSMPVPDDSKAVAGYISCVYNRLHAGSSGRFPCPVWRLETPTTSRLPVRFRAGILRAPLMRPQSAGFPKGSKPLILRTGCGVEKFSCRRRARQRLHSVRGMEDSSPTPSSGRSYAGRKHRPTADPSGMDGGTRRFGDARPAARWCNGSTPIP